MSPRRPLAHDEIEQLQEELKTVKEQRKETPPHVEAKDLPEQSRFRRLSTHSKPLLDTLKMIAYRAETAMANVLAPLLARPDEANAHCERGVAPPRMMKENTSGWKRERSSNSVAVAPRSQT